MKNSLITGASKGIGNYIAKSLSSSHDLILLGRNIKSLHFDFPNAQIHSLDLSRDISKELNSLSKDPIHTFIHSAGLNLNSLLIRSNPIDIHSLFQVNVYSAMNICKHILPGMIKNESGCIILLSSVIGIKGNTGQSVYGASKAALIGFVKSLAREVGSRGIRVNCIAPGFIDIGMTSSLSRQLKSNYLSQIPLQRFGEAKDVLASVEYLLNASYVTGQTLIVDGGLSC